MGSRRASGILSNRKDIGKALVKTGSAPYSVPLAVKHLLHLDGENPETIETPPAKVPREAGPERRQGRAAV